MNDRSENEPITVDLVLPQRLAAVREAFVLAWQQALLGEPPPRLDDFLVKAPDGDLDTLRHALERVEVQFRARAAGEPPDSHADPSAGTVDAPEPDVSTVHRPPQ